MKTILTPILVSIALLFSVDALALKSDSQHLFGYTEYEKSGLSLFPQWLNVLSRHRDDLKTAIVDGQSCVSAKLDQCAMNEWLSFLDSLRSLSKAEQIKQVNLFANKKAYVLDIKNYGIEDYWATPKEFLKNNGDCEDYAIFKYMSLKWLGYDTSKMRVVVVQDTNLRIAHAVMAIERDDTIYILDNQISEVLPHTAIFHYVPVYSVNEEHWWMHVPN